MGKKVEAPIDRIGELKKLAARKGVTPEEHYLKDCANDYVALQMCKWLANRKGAAGECDDGLTWILQRAADALLRTISTPEGIQWRMRRV